MRTIREFLPLQGDPDELRARFLDDPSVWLPDGRRVGGGRWSLSVTGGGFQRRVVADVAEPWASGHTTWRTLSWEPATEDAGAGAVSRLLPALDGELGLHVLGRAVTLVLDGRYRPPGGQLGAAVDALGLHRIARGTVRLLLEEIADLLATAGIDAADAAAADAADDAAGAGTRAQPTSGRRA